MRTVPLISLVVRHCPPMLKTRLQWGISFAACCEVLLALAATIIRIFDESGAP
jgi:hypothetical protein